eukprot:m.61617 g.61617  ORF g.61617 m.61617 type:complete len:135 (+) comp7095_c0_seq1:88-492(+)
MALALVGVLVSLSLCAPVLASETGDTTSPGAIAGYVLVALVILMFLFVLLWRFCFPKASHMEEYCEDQLETPAPPYSASAEQPPPYDAMFNVSGTSSSDLNPPAPVPACMCRREQGYTEGWCGVAGGGVPACDH